MTTHSVEVGLHYPLEAWKRTAHEKCRGDDNDQRHGDIQPQKVRRYLDGRIWSWEHVPHERAEPMDGIADAERLVAAEVIPQRPDVVGGADEQSQKHTGGEACGTLERKESKAREAHARRNGAASHGAESDAREVQGEQGAKRKGRGLHHYAEQSKPHDFV